MNYQTFKPSILNDTTNNFPIQFKQNEKPNLKNSDFNNSFHENKLFGQQLEYIKQLEEQKSIIEGQNQFIQILRNSIENKLQIEGFQEVLNQVLNMSREQKIDLFALLSQLYQELYNQNQNVTQIENLQQLVDNLNHQINFYAKELMELKVDKQYLIDQLDQLATSTKDDDTIIFKEAQIQKLESENHHLKSQIQQLQQKNEKYQQDIQQLEKRLNKIQVNLKTEECEKEELMKELDGLRQTFYKSLQKDEQKQEFNLALKEQEMEFLNTKIKKLEQQNEEKKNCIEEKFKQIELLKYQLQDLEQKFQYQLEDFEIKTNQIKSEYHEQCLYGDQLQEQLSTSEQFIQQITLKINEITNGHDQDILKNLHNLEEFLQNSSLAEQKYQQLDQEKSQIIFDLQHQVTDSQQINQQLQQQTSAQNNQIQQYQNDLKVLDKQKRMFKQELIHMKQLDEQKNKEIQELQIQFSKYDKKLSTQLEQQVELEKENAQLKEQLIILQQQMNNNKNQQSNKKSIACSQVSIQEQKFKNFDYIALLKTFEMVRTMFSVECQDMIQEMLVLQNKLVRTEDIDSDLIQQEIKLQQKFSSQQLKFKDAQFQMAKLSKENKDLKQKVKQLNYARWLLLIRKVQIKSFGQNNSIARYHKQSISVHTKLRPQ
ncbi:unnamed protein product (macronuclear) [Paramecium tetraurelia]|uniref:Uncharacterized protein n=1 Tax=Paramecium tetraurelia TaxID=5888 RepID=A0DA58_PARTE|nr:uncharacterized protein GSPATT00014832001 [Paramecium tetraurelia]CAK79925.1 unnamed protein product [Paramecium tetraurelia]|eukprot:XP_001447322.1 hypothetical protein (macronuclear) [Paramecium tetraurelia strain d4-2]